MPIRAPADATPRERLVLLLLDLYDSFELRRAVDIFDEHHQTSLANAVLGPANSPRAQARSLVDALSDPQIHALLDLVHADRPRRREDIDAVRALFPGTRAD